MPELNDWSKMNLPRIGVDGRPMTGAGDRTQDALARANQERDSLLIDMGEHLRSVRGDSIYEYERRRALLARLVALGKDTA